MIPLTATPPILLAGEPADFRAGIDGFVARCRKHLPPDPCSDTLYVFINRRATLIRILVYAHNGYGLMTKRLSQGRYRGWPRAMVRRWGACRRLNGASSSRGCSDEQAVYGTQPNRA